MDDYFFQIANEAHKYRVSQEYKKSIDVNNIISKEYSMFCCWCYAFKKEENAINFKLYLKTQNKELNFWIKKRIAEVYFNYKYIYDNEQHKWKVYKKS